MLVVHQSIFSMFIIIIKIIKIKTFLNVHIYPQSSQKIPYYWRDSLFQVCHEKTFWSNQHICYEINLLVESTIVLKWSLHYNITYEMNFLVGSTYLSPSDFPKHHEDVLQYVSHFISREGLPEHKVGYCVSFKL